MSRLTAITATPGALVDQAGNPEPDRLDVRHLLARSSLDGASTIVSTTSACVMPRTARWRAAVDLEVLVDHAAQQLRAPEIDARPPCAASEVPRDRPFRHYKSAVTRPAARPRPPPSPQCPPKSPNTASTAPAAGCLNRLLNRRESERFQHRRSRSGRLAPRPRPAPAAAPRRSSRRAPAASRRAPRQSCPEPRRALVAADHLEAGAARSRSASSSSGRCSASCSS